MHGGVTFSGLSDDTDKGGWEIGFDCGHGSDLLPYAPYHQPNGVYRDINFAKAETMKLADQLAAMKKEG